MIFLENNIKNIQHAPTTIHIIKKRPLCVRTMYAALATKNYIVIGFYTIRTLSSLCIHFGHLLCFNNFLNKCFIMEMEAGNNLIELNL